ncbi:type I secretion system permease/ATPase [Microvirga makkahensis]|uniref:Type I secretion system permease/ATPase n=1 Tax=Microvirga makkahensis TaxID=1128670 RepID=A0A7X3SNG0_9HYPH|nr:type I secretion system permease/ATPase [Microvirga makkahensis]MXQ11387.1 type I secretion system permease/ATPase [Microvirga makkahensis]
MKQSSKNREESTEVQDALKACLPSFTNVAVFSAVVNILALTGSVYMLQVYDRVLSSRSIPTLVGLSLLALAAYALSGGLDMLRGRMLARIGARFDEILAPRVFDLVATMPLKGAKTSESMQPIRDVDTIRGFLSGLGPTALFDMPFMPIFLIGCFMIHPWIGVMSVIGGVCIIILTIYTDVKSKEPSYEVTKSGAERHAMAETSRRNAEAIRALGMLGYLGKRYDQVHVRHVNDGLAVSESSAGISAFAKVFRMVLQSGILGLGALLVIEGQMTGGLMIAGSILMSRALAPIEIAVAHWKGFTASRQAYRRLQHIMTLVPPQGQRMPLPAPKQVVSVEEVYVSAPGAQFPIVQAATLRLQAGQGLGLIGPSASGKSTLARALVGVWPTLRGEIRLDGAALDQWEPDSLGRHIGYLPQDVELFEGTVAENISRFHPNPNPEDVIAAAKTAGAHELILGLPDGYDTRIGESGASLSGGQRQRVALARALYGDPFLVVLDEPNASLDGAGDEALNQAILSVRQRGGIVIVITHRPAALGQVDQVAIMEEGRIRAIGPRDEVLQGVMKRNTAPAQAPTVRAQPAQAQAGSLREVG